MSTKRKNKWEKIVWIIVTVVLIGSMVLVPLLQVLV